MSDAGGEQPEPPGPVMLLVDATASTPEENLALDEALYLELEGAAREAGAPCATEALRLWESPTHFVVLGVAGKRLEDVDVAQCAADGIPILRRCSGGGTVLQGPGCLNYTLVLSLEARPSLRDLTASYREILARTAAALGGGIAHEGTSDLAVAGRKLSGNAQKRGRHAILHHGTILHGLDLDRLARYLKEPGKQPPYRARRTHREFVENLPLERDELRRRLCAGWEVHGERRAPLPDVAGLVRERYALREWNERF